jgi:polyisoprenoid-binding protein YceI
MAIAAGTYGLGPGNGTLRVRTRKGGAAAKAGHNLLIEVTDWSATLDVGERSAVELTADAGSLRVREGSGGMSSLGDDDKAGIAQTFNDEVLNGCTISFHSTAVQGGPGSERLAVSGELELASARRPISFELTVDENGRLTGSAVVKQTDHGMKPYSALFGTLKVLDEVTIEVEAKLPDAQG